MENNESQRTSLARSMRSSVIGDEPNKHNKVTGKTARDEKIGDVVLLAIIVGFIVFLGGLLTVVKVFL